MSGYNFSIGHGILIDLVYRLLKQRKASAEGRVLGLWEKTNSVSSTVSLFMFSTLPYQRNY